MTKNTISQEKRISHVGARHVSLMFLLLWMLALATHTSGLVNPVHCDYSTWLRIARDWSDGQSLYGETFDNKNPTVFLLVGLLDSQEPAVSLYFAETLLAACVGTWFWVIFRTQQPTFAMAVPVFLIAFSGTSATFVHGQTTESFVLWSDVIAISCCFLAARKGSAVPAAVSGFFAFLSISFRIPCAIHLVAYIPIAIWAWKRHGQTKALRLMTAFVGSFLFGVLLMFVYGKVDGHWDRFLDVTRYNFQYGAIDRIPFSTSLIGALKILAKLAIDSELCVFLVVLSYIPMSVRKRDEEHENSDFVIWKRVGGLWLIASIVGAFPGGRHYLHYYHVLWGPLSLLAAYGLMRIRRGDTEWFGSRKIQYTLVGTVVTLAVLQNAYGIGKWYVTRNQETNSRRRVMEIAKALRELTEADTPVAMYVWLDHAELYWRVPRNSGTYSIPHVLPDSRLEEWAREILSSKIPFLVIDESFETRSSSGKQFQKLKQVLQKDYREIRRFGSVRIFQRGSQVPELKTSNGEPGQTNCQSWTRVSSFRA